MERNVLLALLLSIAVTLMVAAVIHKEKEPELLIQTPPVPVHYVGLVELNPDITVRVLILKHCRENLADNEARALVQAANLAASEGLSIKDIGDIHVDKNGKVNRLVWGEAMDIEGLERFVDEQMKVAAQEGDTLVIYTTGHGAKSGSVQILGSRHDLGMAFARCAEKNKQETLWWQSSCYAASGLPTMSELNEKQRELFSMIASSSARNVSYWGDQPPRMKTTFLALAKGGTNIDPNQDGIVTAGELRRFLDSEAKSRTGGMVIAASDDEPIFGWLDLPNSLPIIGPDGRPFPNEDRFIPRPEWKASLRRGSYVAP